jgi:hypothetical protein
MRNETDIKTKTKQDIQCTCNVTQWRVRVTTAAVEKRYRNEIA